MAAAACPLPSIAQPRLPVVSMVFTPGDPTRMLGEQPASVPARSFLNQMRLLGWQDGRTVHIERHVASDNPETLARLFEHLARLGTSVYVLAGARWIQEAALRANPATPIVTLFHENPVATGLAKSLAAPGTVTGVTTTVGPELDLKRLQMLREIVPGATRIGFIGPSGQLGALMKLLSDDLLSALVPIRVDYLTEFEPGFQAALNYKVSCCMFAAGPVHYANAGLIAGFAMRNRLPSIFAAREAVEAGGLLSYGPSIADVFARLADMTDRVLKGSAPSEIAIELPTKFELVINRSAASALDIRLPASLLISADDVL